MKTATKRIYVKRDPYDHLRDAETNECFLANDYRPIDNLNELADRFNAYGDLLSVLRSAERALSRDPRHVDDVTGKAKTPTMVAVRQAIAKAEGR